MKFKAGVVSFFASFVCCGIVVAAGVFTNSNSNRDAALPAYDGTGLLVPQIGDISELGGVNGLNGIEVESSSRYKSRPVYRSNLVASETTSNATASSDRPWGVAALAIAGLVGGLGAVALGGWRRWNQQEKSRASVPNMLMANLSLHQPRVDETNKLAEPQSGTTRRAA